MTREEKVKQFMDAARKKSYSENPASFDLILDLIEEETHEFFTAAEEHREEGTKGTRANLCKEWADLQYVLSQAAVYFDIPADPAFNRVHESNMTKVVDGFITYRADGKILKPDAYQAPDMSGL